MKIQADSLRDESETRRRNENSRLLQQRLSIFFASHKRHLQGKMVVLSRFGEQAHHIFEEFDTITMNRDVFRKLSDLSAFTESGYISGIQARSYDFLQVRNQLEAVLALAGKGFQADDEQLMDFGAFEMSNVLQRLSDQWKDGGVDAH